MNLQFNKRHALTLTIHSRSSSNSSSSADKATVKLIFVNQIRSFILTGATRPTQNAAREKCSIKQLNTLFWKQANIKSNGIETIRIQIFRSVKFVRENRQMKNENDKNKKRDKKRNRMKWSRESFLFVCVFRSAQIRRYPNPVKVSRENEK